MAKTVQETAIIAANLAEPTCTLASGTAITKQFPELDYSSSECSTFSTLETLSSSSEDGGDDDNDDENNAPGANLASTPATDTERNVAPTYEDGTPTRGFVRTLARKQDRQVVVAGTAPVMERSATQYSPASEAKDEGISLED